MRRYRKETYSKCVWRMEADKIIVVIVCDIKVLLMSKIILNILKVENIFCRTVALDLTKTTVRQKINERTG